tara:strand:+ start:14092 stop:14592 length:501 start_codon:yes stop_codon:yes gene_type:complete
MSKGFSKYDYPPFDEWVWKSFDRKRKIELDEWIANNYLKEFFVGTDSQVYGNKTTFTTCLIAYEMGRGGTIVLHSDKTESFKDLRPRLLQEAMRSVQAAWYLDERIPAKSNIAIHLDVNESDPELNLRFKSGKYKEELVGLVIAQGFDCSYKPDSWASSTVADRRC